MQTSLSAGSSVTAPAGGEMSGLIAHFLFAAILGRIRPADPAELPENKGKPPVCTSGSATGNDGALPCAVQVFSAPAVGDVKVFVHASSLSLPARQGKGHSLPTQNEPEGRS